MFSFFKGLVSSHSCGDKISHTKVWSNIGMASMTAVFIYLGFWGVLPEWYLFTYASVVAAPYLIDKIITLRWGISKPETDTKNIEEKANE